MNDQLIMKNMQRHKCKKISVENNKIGIYKVKLFFVYDT